LHLSPKDIDDIGEKYIAFIDGASLIDKNIGTIKTPFGVTSIKDLSTGAKTVLNVMHVAKNKLDYAVDITECGWNAIDCIFEFLDQNDNCVQILLQHVEFRECKDHEYLVNDSIHCKDTEELSRLAFRKIVGKED
jgi:hypothetical protein